jgi:hypothetical protein
MSKSKRKVAPQSATTNATATPLVPPADEKAVVELYKTWKQRRDQLREAIQTHADTEPATLRLAFDCWQLTERDTAKAKALAADPTLVHQVGEPTNAAEYHNGRVQGIISIINSETGAYECALMILKRFAGTKGIDPAAITARNHIATVMLAAEIDQLCNQHRPGLRPTYVDREKTVLKVVNELGTDSAGNHKGVKVIIKELRRRGKGQRPQITREILRELNDKGKYKNPPV